MLDLAIRNGIVVTPGGAGEFDVGISGEKIATIASRGMGLVDAARTLDASGMMIVPGGIDPHIHSKWGIPATEDAPEAFTADIEQVSRAALFGGTTTLIDFAVWQRGTSIERSIEVRNRDFQRSHCDYAFHIMLTGAIPRPVLDELPDAIVAGHPSVKIFTTDITPSRRGRRVAFGDIWEVLRQLHRYGGIAAIHAEDDELVMHMYDRMIVEGRTHFRHMPEVHSGLSEDLAFHRIIRLAQHVDVPLYMMHVSAKEGVEAIAQARARGYRIYGETLHQYALFSADAYAGPNGQIYHTYPSLKFDSDRDALWKGMAEGTIGTVATDELCTLLAVKVRGSRIDDTTGGNSGVEPRMGVIYTEAVANRGFSLDRFVDLTSANAARYLGLYPRKGAIAVGSDADIAIIDPTQRFVLDNGRLHETDYSPWEGWSIKGWPTMTILRGKVVVENGKLTGEPGYGRWTPRKL